MLEYITLTGFFHEVIDGYLSSPDSPVLWLRVDPEMTTLRQVTLEQPDYMWQYMLKYERDVVAQAEVSDSKVISRSFDDFQQKCVEAFMFHHLL